jgi:hypothetical protein
VRCALYAAILPFCRLIENAIAKWRPPRSHFPTLTPVKDERKSGGTELAAYTTALRASKGAREWTWNNYKVFPLQNVFIETSLKKKKTKIIAFVFKNKPINYTENRAGADRGTIMIHILLSLIIVHTCLLLDPHTLLSAFQKKYISDLYVNFRNWPRIC